MQEVTWDKLIKNGIFAALFVCLLVYTIDQNKKRESEYISTIKEVTATNGKYAELIKIDLAEIKSKLPR